MRRLLRSFMVFVIGLGVALAPSAPALATSTPVLGAGQTLLPGESLTSANGQYHLVMQTNGDLVTYGPGASVQWHSGSGVPGSSLVMQVDGNLVVYGPGVSVAWHAQTTGLGPGLSLTLQDDGNAVLYSPGNGPVWSTHLGRTGRTGHSLAAGHQLDSGQWLSSPNGLYHLIMQTDGNLVLYGPQGAQWHTGTGTPGSAVAMQGDGNLVVYAPGVQPVWSAQTGGSGASVLEVQDDGNLVLYGPSGAIWSVRTGPVGTVGTRGQTLAATAANPGFSGNCTWWVYEQTKAVIGVYPSITGDAHEMDTNAAARGWTVTSTPRARSILVRQPNVAGASSLGHVMWVKEVAGGSVRISDMNWSGPYAVRDDVWVSVQPSDRFVLID